MEKSQPLVIVVEGIIGAGKTTLINQCLKKYFEKDGLRVTIIEEPVKNWKEDGLLELFYKNPQRYAYHFQTKAFHDRVKVSQKKYQAHKDHTDIFLVERSVFSDRFFMNTLKKMDTITDLEYKHYREWWDLWTEVVPFVPDLFLYLRPPSNTCMERVKKRHRAGETSVTLEYQKLLLGEHDAFFIAEQIEIRPGVFVSCQTLETDKDFSSDVEVQKDIFTKVKNQLRKI